MMAQDEAQWPATSPGLGQDGPQGLGVYALAWRQREVCELTPAMALTSAKVHNQSVCNSITRFINDNHS